MPLDGVEASMATVRNGTYPLTRPLNLVARGRARGLALTFIEFARSEAARSIVEHQFFVLVDPSVPWVASYSALPIDT
jgi:phosphate transport system substrate-binding protein